MWTRFMDMHSGGGTKEGNYGHIYIEAPEGEAITIFYNKFDHNPNRVTCTCCGEDYSISEAETLEEITRYDRGVTSSYRDTMELGAYKDLKRVLFIFETDIKEEERSGDVPEEGYVWV